MQPDKGKFETLHRVRLVMGYFNKCVDSKREDHFDEIVTLYLKCENTMLFPADNLDLKEFCEELIRAIIFKDNIRVKSLITAKYGNSEEFKKRIK